MVANLDLCFNTRNLIAYFSLLIRLPVYPYGLGRLFARAIRYESAAFCYRRAQRIDASFRTAGPRKRVSFE